MQGLYYDSPQLSSTGVNANRFRICSREMNRGVSMEAPGSQLRRSCQGVRQAWGHLHSGFPVPWGRVGSGPGDVPSLPQTHSIWDVSE